MPKYPTPEELATWMRGRTFASAKSTYRVIDANAVYVLFESTGSTGRVMLPTTLVLEWITAAINGRFSAADDPRAMREKVYAQGSQWAKQLHSFETHLAAVVRGWR